MQKNQKLKQRCLYFPKRITDAMSKIMDYPLTIVEAPMGYGKTTAVLEYLNKTDTNLLWQNIYDSSNLVFWRSFCRHIKKVDVDCGLGLENLGFPDDSLSLNTALLLISDIKFTKKTVLVFDDMNLSDMHKVMKFLNILVKNKIFNLHIVLIARFFDFLHTSELTLKGYLYHIKKETFEFTQKEIINYYKLCGISLTAFEANDIFNLTQGWISALYLLQLNYKDSSKSLTSIDFHTLIKQEIYDRFSSKTQTFLLIMSIFDSFTLKQAEYMMPNANIEQTIANILYKNAFVTYDKNHKIYIIHSIFKSFLWEQLEKKKESFSASVYQKAAKWYLQNKEYLNSIKYSYMIGDFETMLEALEGDRGQSINGEHKDLLIKYYRECPLEIKKNHLYGLLIFAWLMFTFNEILLYKEVCELFWALFKQIKSLDIDYKNRLLGEYELILSFSQFNNIQEMCKYYKRSSKLLKEPSQIITKKTSWTYGSPSVLYLFYRKSGELLNEVKAMRELMPCYYEVTGDNGKGAEDIISAEYFYYIGDFLNAEINMHRAYNAASGPSGIKICVAYLNIKLAFMEGDFTKVLDLFKQIREEIIEKKWYMFIHTIDICEAYIFSCLHMTKKVKPWIKNGEFQNTRLFFPAIAYLNTIYGKVLLTNGEYLKLIAFAKDFFEADTVFINLLAQINMYIYLAAAYFQIKKKDEAVFFLQKALDIAMKDKLYMPFVESCYYIKPLLEELKKLNINEQGIKKILELYRQYHQSARRMIRECESLTKPELTKRESMVAHLAAQGFSNKEIGRKLFISHNTVKTQMKSIFFKLDISSRLQLKQKLK